MKPVVHDSAFTTHEVHRAVVEPELVAEVRSGFARMITEVASLAGSDRTELSRLVSAWENANPQVRAAMQALSPRVRASLVERGSAWAHELGDPVNASLFVVAGPHGQGTHAHQDLSYKWNRPVDVRYAYTTWVALDACSETSGALRLSCGLSASEASVRQDFLRRDFVDLASTAEWRRCESVACAQRGDVVMFDALAWHASAPVESCGERMALAIRWRSRSGWEKDVRLERPASDNKVFGMDTSGRVLCDAVRRACGNAPSSPAPTVQHALRELRDEYPAVLARMSPGGRAALHDLSLALRLGEEHHARPSAAVWCRVRDVAIPDLESFATGCGK